MVLALDAWGDEHATAAYVTILGDNTGSLQDALDLKGAGALNTLSMELSWRKALRNWHFEVGHLPTEANSAADSLSRLAEGATLPTKLEQARCISPPSLLGFFRTLRELGPPA